MPIGRRIQGDGETGASIANKLARIVVLARCSELVFATFDLEGVISEEIADVAVSKMSLMSDLRRLRIAYSNRQQIRPKAKGNQNNAIAATRSERQVAEKRANKNSDEKLVTWTLVVALFTGVLAIASIAGDIFSYFTLRAISGQLVEMQSSSKQTDELLKSNKELASAAGVQAENAKQSVVTARDTMTATQRAWVGPVNANVVGNVQIGAPVVIKIGIFNTGREPAKSFSEAIEPITTTGESSIFSMDIVRYVSTCFATPARSQAQVIYPSSGLGGGGFEFQTTFDANKIDQDVIDGRTILVVRGCLTYQTSGQTKHSSFCYFYKGGITKPENLNICKGGSDAE